MSTERTGRARLDPLVGLWDTNTTTWIDPETRPTDVDGSVEKSWVLGGLYLREDLAGVTEDGAPQMGLGFLGYDPQRGVYQGVWLSTGHEGLVTYEGHGFDDCLVLMGDEPAHGGGRRRFRAVLTIESTDAHSLEQSFLAPDGTWHKAFRIEYRRVAESAVG